MLRSVFLIGLVITSLFTGNIMAGEAYYGFLEEPINPRVSAMGSAGTALLNGSGFSFYNPALPSIDRPYINLEFGKLFDDLGRGQVELGLNFPSWFLAASFQSQSIEFEYSDERGIKSGSIGSDQGVMASICAGLKKDRFALGLTFNGIHQRIASDYSYGFTGSTGALYQVIPGKLIAAASILHFYGRNTGFIDSLEHFRSDKLPMTTRAGLSWSDSIRGKVAYTISSDIVYSANNDIVMVPIGVEAWILPVLALRLGKKINHPTDVLTMGLGLKLINLRYDVAFTPIRLGNDIEMKWTMGLTYELPFVSKIKKADQKKTDTLKAVPVINDTSKPGEENKNSAFSIDKPINGDSLGLELDSVLKPAIPVDHSSDSSINLEDQSKNKDSTESVPVELENNSGKETSSDSVLIQKSIDSAVVDSTAIKKEVEIDSSRQAGSLISEKKEAQSSVPVDSNAAKK